MTLKPAATIYTDGACSQNPGPGGWAAIVLVDDKEKRMSGGATETTNNRMELMGVISGLSALKGPHTVTVYSDSQYIINAFNKGWIKSWKNKGWERSDGPLKNKDLWQTLDKITAKHTITWVWVKGHAGNKYNEICDQMAVAEVKKYQNNTYMEDYKDVDDSAFAAMEDEDSDIAGDSLQKNPSEEEADNAISLFEQNANKDISDETQISEDEENPVIKESETKDDEEDISEDDYEPEAEEGSFESAHLEDEDLEPETFTSEIDLCEISCSNQQELNSSLALSCFTAFIRETNKKEFGIETPCGACAWCDYCASSEGLPVHSTSCAVAYINYKTSPENN